MVILVRAALCAAVLAWSAPALAEKRIEEILFEDCDTAKERFSKLSPAEQAPVVGFLPRIIALNTQAPGVPEPFAQLPGQARPGEVILPGAGRAPDPAIGSLWQNMDAKRELRGKRCALEILELAGASALQSLPSLADIYSREPLSDEIAVGLEEAAATIAELAHRQGKAPSPAEIDLIVPLLTSERPLVSSNFLQEFVGLTLPSVVRHLSLIDGTDGSRVVAFLREADPDGSRGMRAFLDLLVALPDEQQQRLARQIPLPAKEALPQFVPEFARLAGDGAKSVAFVPLLARSCTALGEVSVDAGTGSALAQRNAFDQLSLDEQRCLLRSIPALNRRAVAMLGSRSSEEQRNAISLFASFPKLFSPEQRAAAWTRVRELALSADPEVQRAALAEMARAPERRGELSALLMEMLTTPDPGLSPAGSPSRREAALQALAELGGSKETSRFIPIVLAALEADPLPPGAIRFLAKSEPALPEVVRLLSPSSSPAAPRALQVLAAQEPLMKGAVQPLVEALHSPQLGRAAEAVLARAPAQQVVPAARRALPRSQGHARTSLLAVLQAAGAASKAESSELLAALDTEGCSQLAERGPALLKLASRKDLDTALQASLRKRSLACLGQLPEDTARQALSLPLPEQLLQSPQSAEALASTPLSDELQERLIDSILNTPLPPATLAAALKPFLVNGSRPVRIKVLRSPQARAVLVPALAQAAQTIADQANNDGELRAAALSALVAANDTSYDWREFVQHAIDALGRGEVQGSSLKEILRQLPPALVLEEVGKALNSDSQEKLIGGCQAGASLGTQAVPIVSKVWSLREKRAPAVRYAAVLALLEINPLTPDLQEQLRRLLVNRYFPAAMKDRIEWRNTVAVVDLDRSSFGALRALRLEELIAPR